MNSLRAGITLPANPLATIPSRARPASGQGAVDACIEGAVLGEMLDGSDDLLWRPLDDSACGPYRLQRWSVDALSDEVEVEWEVVSEDFSYEVADNDGGQIHVEAFTEIVRGTHGSHVLFAGPKNGALKAKDRIRRFLARISCYPKLRGRRGA